MAALPLPIRPVVSLTGVSDCDVEEIVASTRHLADDLRGACILVTGASGWFGTWLLDGLVAIDRAGDLGLRIVALCRRPGLVSDRQPALYAAPQITWIAGDVRGPVLPVDVPLTHVIHAATPTAAAAAEQPELLFDTIVSGTRNVFDCARRRRARRFLFVSSGAVYGPQSADVARLSESSFDPTRAIDDAYASGKRTAESDLLASSGNEGPVVTIARCFAFVGPHMPLDGHFAIGNFVRDAVAGRPVRVVGDGRARRSYLYASDLVTWLLAILVDGQPKRVYNVGGAEAVTIGSLARRCADRTVHRTPVEMFEHGAAGRDYVPDVSRAVGELELHAVPLDEALDRTMKWAASPNTMVSA